MWHLRVTIVTYTVLATTSLLVAREWTDKSGSSRVEADLVTVKNGKVYLEKEDGRTAAIPLELLSKEDVQYLLSLPECQAYFEEHPIPGIDRPKPDMGVIQVDDPDKVGEVRRFPDLGWGVKSLAFSPDGRLLAAGKMDRALMVFDVDKSTRTAFLEGLEGLEQVTCVTFTPDGRKLLAGGYRGRIQIWDVSPDGALTEAGRFVGHNKEVKTITVSADGRCVLSGGAEKMLRYWKLDTAAELFAIDGFDGAVKASFLTRGGKQGLGCDGQTLALIDIKQGKVIQKMELANRSANAVAIAPDGSSVIVNDMYALRMWDIRSGKEHPRLQEQEIQWFATFLPNSRYILSGGRAKTNLWEVATQRKLYEFDMAGTSYVQMIAASPDNRHFAAIPDSSGQTLQVFRLPAKIAED